MAKKNPEFLDDLVNKVDALEKTFEAKIVEFNGVISKIKLRVETEAERQLQISKQKFVLGFLEVLDNLERANFMAGEQESIAIGLELTVELFKKKLKESGVEQVDVLNQPYNPELARAIGVVTTNEQERDNTVATVDKNGYTMDGVLFRAADVRVYQFVPVIEEPAVLENAE